MRSGRARSATPRAAPVSPNSPPSATGRASGLAAPPSVRSRRRALPQTRGRLHRQGPQPPPRPSRPPLAAHSVGPAPPPPVPSSSSPSAHSDRPPRRATASSTTANAAWCGFLAKALTDAARPRDQPAQFQEQHLPRHTNGQLVIRNPRLVTVDPGGLDSRFGLRAWVRSGYLAASRWRSA